MQKTVLELYCRRPLFSLQKMSLIRITTTLCNNRQLLALIMKCKFQKDFDSKLYTRRGPEWAAVHAMANEMISEISNCIKLNERVMEFLWPVCYKIMLWKFMYAPSIGNQFLSHFYFTDQGRIDNRRTAKHIIGNQNISVRKRFVLACSVCLSKEILDIWWEMTKDDRMYFRAENREKIRPLLLFWIFTMERSDGISRQFMNGACICALENGLLDALKYLFAISAEDARKEMAYSYTPRFFYKINDFGYLEEDELDIGYFLFFEMSDDNRYVMSALPSLELTLLLHFSEREHFFNALEEHLQSPLWGVIIVLLNIMFFNYHLEIVNDDDYRKIFVHIWQMIPASLKNEVADSNAGGRYLSILIRDNFPFLLRKGAFEKIAELTSVDSKPSTSVKPFCFHRDKWEFLHFLIEEEVATIPTLKRLRRDMKGELKIRNSNKAAWNRILRFVQKVGSKNRQ
ncbi:hypothetical protein AVEN_161716-1 [Araneus ventricosus]|uniref:Uncharacterized protein n=1 Tax=Araneus ventricosus TaxID=182803 RepID=A0A4Y2PB33_ARAVE|nr:hypothetical protein AVEN_161716-1 [Araneus ventricosus]